MRLPRPAHLLLAAALLTPVPVGAAEPETPALAGVNKVTATGAASIDVTLPGGASFVQRVDAPRAPGWADITTTGTFAALAVVSESETVNDAVPVNAFELHLVAPDA